MLELCNYADSRQLTILPSSGFLGPVLFSPILVILILPGSLIPGHILPGQVAGRADVSFRPVHQGSGAAWTTHPTLNW